MASGANNTDSYCAQALANKIYWTTQGERKTKQNKKNKQKQKQSSFVILRVTPYLNLRHYLFISA